MKKIAFIIFILIVLCSCGPRRLGCGPRRCSIDVQKDIWDKQLPQKNPEVRTSGLV